MFSVWDLPELLLDQVMVTSEDDCWYWVGRINNKGYGQNGAGLAHRETYMNLVGMIAKDMTLDHLCRNKRCVNPNHLEEVSRGENARRVFNHPPYGFIDHTPAPKWTDADIVASLRRVFVGMFP